MSLKEVLEKVESHETDISGWLGNYPDNLRQFVLSNNYYWGLAAYIDLHDVKHVLEFGTCTGASAVVMSQAGAAVDTYDLNDFWQLPGCPDNVTCHLADDPRYIYSVDLRPYDMIFVDIDHMGVEEPKLHKKFIKEFRGIVFYDDIWLNQPMRDFWNSIEQDKETCLWHKTSGFGVVRYE
jgi:hypothetical protein